MDLFIEAFYCLKQIEKPPPPTYNGFLFIFILALEL